MKPTGKPHGHPVSGRCVRTFITSLLSLEPGDEDRVRYRDEQAEAQRERGLAQNHSERGSGQNPAARLLLLTQGPDSAGQQVVRGLLGGGCPEASRSPAGS